jgi:flagellar basal-body rod modification protein FlgD
MISSVGNGNANSATLNLGGNQILRKDDFLKLLVTQLRNQNPLSPMKDEEFVAQLAQFSSLEQLQNMNENLAVSQQWNLILSQTINNTMATSLIGKNVKAIGGSIFLPESAGVEINYELSSPANKIIVEIYDKDNNLVKRIEKETSSLSGKVEWDGKNEMGTKVLSGEYKVKIKGETSTGETINATHFIIGKVDAVKYEEGNAYLLVNEQKISLADVREIYQ